MSERWSPGSSDFIRVLDYGSAAAWVRPEDDGATIAVYLGDYYVDGRADIWTVRVRSGSALLNQILDKPWRVNFAEGEDEDDHYQVVSCEHRRASSTHYGHPRCNWKRHLNLYDNLPRRVREAIRF